MSKKIKRIIVTRTIVYDRDCHPQPLKLTNNLMTG